MGIMKSASGGMIGRIKRGNNEEILGMNTGEDLPGLAICRFDPFVWHFLALHHQKVTIWLMYPREMEVEPAVGKDSSMHGE
jgi:hypothetical protein